MLEGLLPVVAEPIPDDPDEESPARVSILDMRS